MEVGQWIAEELGRLQIAVEVGQMNVRPAAIVGGNQAGAEVSSRASAGGSSRGNKG